MTEAVLQAIAFTAALGYLTVSLFLGIGEEYVPLVMAGLAAYLFFHGPGKMARRLGVLSTLVFVFLLLSRFSIVFLPLSLGMLIAFLLNPLVDFLARYRVRRWISSLVLLLFFALILLAFMSVVVYEVGRQATVLAQVLPGYVNQWRISLEGYLKRLGATEELLALLPTQAQVFQTVIMRFTGFMRNLLSATFNSFLLVVISIVVGLYLLVDYHRIGAWLRSFLEEQDPEGRIQRMVEEVGQILRRYFRGQLLDATVVGVLTGVLLALLGVGFPVLLGFLAGLFNMVPNFGFWMSFIPALLVGLMGINPVAGVLKVSFVFGIVQLAESAFFGPRIIGGSVGLHPLVILLALVVGGELFGPLGLIIAVPTAAVIRSLLRRMWEERKKKRAEAAPAAPARSST